MDGKVLVAYASRYGSTERIAAKIGETLTLAGLQVDVLSADNVKDIAQYQAVVLGSATYIYKWIGEAVKLLKRNEKLLTDKPVWIFSSGPLAEGDAVKLLKGWRYPQSLRAAIERIKPRDIVVFHGMIDIEGLNFMDKWLIKNS